MKKEKPKFLRVLYLEVEKCKGEYTAKDKMFFSSAYKRLVYDAWVGGLYAWQKVLVTLPLL